ncbi:MAG TPA: serine hydrolase domain-containing protein, partial [Rhodanobacteraceae bacterium]|nr:serine hydrolase domain-containing protein [Rhodanobacteraceae bacterium]
MSRALVTIVLFAAMPVMAAAALPDTPTGKLAGALIQHVNADTPADLRRWAPTVLSAAIDRTEQAGFIDNLVSATRDAGGVAVTDVRRDPRQPGLLEVVVKGRRRGTHALFVLAADPAQSGKLGQAELVPMGDPALYAGWPRGAVSHAELARLAHAALDRLVRTADFSGCLSVVDGGKTVFDECRGLAERRFGVPVDRQTKFHVGSIDKMFTAVAIAQLVEAGKLSWDDSLAARVPEYPDRTTAKKITVWELLHHTAGLGDFLLPEYFAHRERFVDPLDYLGLIARQPVVSEPGKQWNYSNAGYMLLGRIIETVSGEPYSDYIRHHVFAPAGMESRGFDRLDE